MKLNLLNTIARGHKVALATVAIAAMAAATAYASPINIHNGGFDTSSNSSSELSNGSYYGATISGWTNQQNVNAYNFVFVPGDSSANSSYGHNNVSLYSNPTSPDRGSFLAMDSDFGQGSVSQEINHLIVGDLVTVNFDFAGAQQVGASGASTDYIAVSLGGQTLDTQTLDDSNHGFTGWYSESLTFTATNTNELLSFLSVGTPSGVPSFVLLDGVKGSQNAPSPVPEPESLVLLATGLLGLGGVVRSRFSK